MLPPPPTFPLPAKPVSAQVPPNHHSQRPPASQPQRISLPTKPAHLSTSQPSSPRLPATQYGTTGSTPPPPRPSLRSVPQPGAQSLSQDSAGARARLRRALASDDLAPTLDVLELGLGWKVYWRAWRGPPLLASSSHATDGSTASTSSSQLKSDSTNTRYGTALPRPSTPNLSTSAAAAAPTATTADSTKHGAQRQSASENLTADLVEDVSLPTASTSAPTTLRDRIQSLQQVSAENDPIEVAHRKIATLAHSTSTPLSLFSYVKVSALKAQAHDSSANEKGKGKAVEEEESARRILWAFSLRRGSSAEPDNTSRTALSALEFPSLTSIGKGHFSHRELFPELYQSSSTDATAKASPDRPKSLLESDCTSYPSVCSISSELHSNPAAPASSPAGKFKAPFEAFIAALTDNILGIMLSVDDDTNRAVRLGSELVYLPRASGLLKQPASDVFSASIKLSLLSEGVLIQPKVVAKPYRAVDVSQALPPTTRLLLAPCVLPAELVKVFASDACQSSPSIQALRSTWAHLLEGTGLKLRQQEDWVLCRIHLPACSNSLKQGLGPLPVPTTGLASEVLDLMWPASLCVVDAASSPPVSPDSSPKRPRAVELTGLGPSSPAASLMITRPRSNTNPAVNSPRALTDARRKGSTDLTLARRAARLAFASSSFSDPLVASAGRVASILEHLAEEQERKERLEKEDEAALKAQPAPPPTPISSDLGRPTPLPNMPVNMRTPISLGGITTEASSPADGFIGTDKNLLASLGYGVVGSSAGTLNAGTSVPVSNVEQLYPSPDELNTATYSSAPEVAMPLAAPMASAPPVDNAFSDFDWGDDFSGTMNRGLRTSTNQEFDDGMMMGLTDDDFSFFDEPAPLPVSLPMPSTSFDTTTQSADPSPKFVDHFNHLTGPQGFAATAASPSSPFAHASPMAHVSPGLNGLNFSFDSHNMLGLGNTPTAAQLEVFSHKTPRTPFSPFVELTDDQQESPAFSVSSVSVAGTPAHTVTSLRPVHNFEAIQFGKSHAALDDKYDVRKGKFGLPSPEWDTDALPGSVGHVLRKKSLGNSNKPSIVLFSAVCDPRVSAAMRLRSRKNRSGSKSIGKRQSLLSKRLVAKPWSLPKMRSWISHDTLSETDGDDSDDDAMDGVESTLFDGVDEGSSSDGLQAGGPIAYTFGAALLLLHGHLVPLLAGKSSDADTSSSASKSSLIAQESQLEQTIEVFSDQFLMNPDFRRDCQQSLTKQCSAKMVSSRAISLFQKALRQFTTQCRTKLSSAPSNLPQLAPCPAPTLVVRSQQSLVKLATTAFDFWRPMSFQPLSGSKDVTAFAVCEDAGGDLGDAVSSWLTRVGETYQSLRLGSHEPGTLKSSSTFAGSNPGVCVVAKGTMLDAKNKDEWRGFSSHLIEAARQRKHVVLYLLMPQDDVSLSATSSIIVAIQQIAKARQPNVSLLVYPVPVASVVGWRSLDDIDKPSKRLEQLAFAVYDQLLMSVSSLAFPVPETFPAGNMMRPQTLGPQIRSCQAPAIWMSPKRLSQISFTFKWPPPSLEIMHRHHLMHVAYAWLPGQAPNTVWIILSCIDERGEIWKTLPKLSRISPDMSTETAVARHVWAITRMLSETADVEYQFVICRVGIPSRLEIKAFESLLKEVLPQHKRPVHVTLVAVENDAPLAVLKQPESSKASTVKVVSPRAMQEDGELDPSSPSVSTDSSSMSSANARVLRLVPHEPVAIGSHSNLMAPASAYLVHLPQVASLTHLDKAQPFMPSASSSSSTSSSSNAVSVYGLHFLLSNHSPTSQLSMTLSQHVEVVSQSFVELEALGKTRWNASGRLAWHVEAVQALVNLVESVGHSDRSCICS
ncbi:hypothetical protein ACM66B_003018 [Microbotryomycetes sp. NB124-2]